MWGLFAVAHDCFVWIRYLRTKNQSFRTLHRNDFLTASPGVFKVRCEPLGEVQHPHGVKKQFVVVGNLYPIFMHSIRCIFEASWEEMVICVHAFAGHKPCESKCKRQEMINNPHHSPPRFIQVPSYMAAGSVQRRLILMKSGKGSSKEHSMMRVTKVPIARGQKVYVIFQLFTGETFLTYAATALNCPLLRIANKYMDKPILKARYLPRGSSRRPEDNWRQIRSNLADDVTLTQDFESLIQREEDRFLDYFVSEYNPGSMTDILAHRECEFTRKVRRVTENNRGAIGSKPTTDPPPEHISSSVVIDDIDTPILSPRLAESSNETSFNRFDEFIEHSNGPN